MKRLITLLTTIGIFCSFTAFVHAQDEAAIAEAIEGKWYGWDLKTSSPEENGLISITFRYQTHDKPEKSTVSWETASMGKRTTHSGVFSLERSANLFNPTSVTWSIRIHDLSSAYSKDDLIHLINLNVSEDNRVMRGEKVLKFHDGFYTNLFLRRKVTPKN